MNKLSPVLLMIDHFGSGGAQRQIVAIANGLIRKGRCVHIVNYYPEYDHHRQKLDKRVVVHDLIKRDRLGINVIFKLLLIMKEYKYSSAMAFLDTPALYLEVAYILSPYKCKLIYSERSSLSLKKKGVLNFIKSWLHKTCSHFTSNSIVQTDLLRRKYGEDKVSYIPNIMDQSLFSHEQKLYKENVSRFVVLSHTRPFKNFQYVADALIAYKERYGDSPPTVDWYGTIYESMEMDRVLESLAKHDLKNNLVFHDAVSDVRSILKQASFLIHVSKFESSPNAVSEALSSSTPVILGDIDEHKEIINRSSAGVIVNLNRPIELSDTLRKLEFIKKESYLSLSSNAKKYAYSNFREDSVIESYNDLLQ